MLKISSEDATFHAARDLIYALQNPAPASSLVKIGDGKRDSLITLAVIFRQFGPPAVPLRVRVREGVQEKLKEVNQDRVQMKSASQSKPVTDEEPLKVNILE